MKVVCPRCGYRWNSRSTRRFVTCPNCYSKIRNPYWSSATGTSTGTTTTTTGTGTTRSFNEIGVWVADVPRECYRDLRELAEEVSSPDSSGVEVLVLDSGVAVEVLRHYGVELDAR